MYIYISFRNNNAGSMILVYCMLVVYQLVVFIFIHRIVLIEQKGANSFCLAYPIGSNKYIATVGIIFFKMVKGRLILCSIELRLRALDIIFVIVECVLK